MAKDAKKKVSAMDLPGDAIVPPADPVTAPEVQDNDEEMDVTGFTDVPDPTTGPKVEPPQMPGEVNPPAAGTFRRSVPPCWDIPTKPADKPVMTSVKSKVPASRASWDVQ